MGALEKAEMSVEYCRDVQDAAKLVQRALVAYRDRHRGPVLIAAQVRRGLCRTFEEKAVQWYAPPVCGVSCSRHLVTT